MNANRFAFGLRALAVATAIGMFGSQAYAAATITIVNANAAGVGFNDPTPAAPVGGNNGSTLTSSVTIVVRAQFTSLDCDASSAVLGSAGPTSVFRDFANAPFASTWYHSALADRLAQTDLSPGQPDIAANFNADLGQPDC